MSAFDTPDSAAQRYSALANAPPADATNTGPSLMDGFATDLAKIPTDIAGRFVYNLEESAITPARLAIGHALGDQGYIDSTLDTQKQMQQYYQDNFVAPATSGAASQVIIHGLAIPLTEYALANLSGGKYAAAGYAGLTAFNTAKIGYESQGVDSTTAAILALGQGAVAGGTALIPGGVGAKEGATKAINALRVGGTQGLINLVTGVGSRAATQAYLESNGYHDLAAQVHPFSVSEGVVDAALGFGLGYLHTRYFPHAVAKPGAKPGAPGAEPGAPGAEPTAPGAEGAPTPAPMSDVEAANARAEALAAGDIAALGGGSAGEGAGGGEPPDEGGGAGTQVPVSPTLDDAMTLNSVGHANMDVAPGVPADAEAANAHDEAVKAGANALIKGEPVAVESAVEGAHFLPHAPEVEAQNAEHLAGANVELNTIAREQAEDRAHDLGIEPEKQPPVEKPITAEDVRGDIGREAEPLKTAVAGQKAADRYAEGRRRAFLNTIKKFGGINPDQAKDLTGETTQASAMRVHPGLFRQTFKAIGKDYGHGLDIIARHLHQEGYLTDAEYDDTDGGLQRTRDLIQQALHGESVMRPDEQIEHARLLDATEHARHVETMQDVGKNLPGRFWTDRPDKTLTVQGAHAALDRAARGEPLGAREQRFVDYANEEAARREEERQAVAKEARETQDERAAIQADNTPQALEDSGYNDVPLPAQLEVANILSHLEYYGDLDAEASAAERNAAVDDGELLRADEAHGPTDAGEDIKGGGEPGTAQERARRYNGERDAVEREPGAGAAEPAGAANEAIRKAQRDPYTQDIFGRALPEADAGRPEDGGTVPAGGVDDHAGATVPAREIERGVFATVVKHVKTAVARLGLTRIKSAADAAHAFAYLRKLPQENLVIMTVDKDGKPLAISRHSLGGRASTPFELPTIMGAALRDPRAAAFYVAHNHPSGAVSDRFSEGDLQAHNMIRDAAHGGRVDYKGFFAIAGRKFVFTGPDKADVYYDTHGVERGNIPPGARTHEVPIEERRFERTGKMGDVIDSPAKAMEAARDIAKGQEGIILLSHQHQPVGFLPVDIRSLQNMRGKLADRFWSAIEATNAGAMIAVSQGTIQDVRYGALSNLATFGERAGVRMIDAVTFGDQQHLAGAVSPASSSVPFREPAPKGGLAEGKPGAPKPADDLALTPYTNDDILRREQEQQAQSKRDVESAAAAKAKAIADGQRDAFALTGSDRVADKAGQGDLFEPAAPYDREAERAPRGEGYGEYPGTLDDPVPRDVVLEADDARIAEAQKAPDVLGAAVQCFLTMGGP